MISHDFEKLRKLFATGHTLPYSFRKAQLEALYESIRRHEEEIHRALATDLGKSTFESYVSEVGFCLSEITHTLRHLKSWMKPKRVRTPLVHFPSTSRIYRRPKGTCLIIGPWNYPFQLLISPLVGSIAGGNTSVLKPSELAPATADVVNQLISKTFDASFVSVVSGGVKETTELLSLPFDHIFFTGSIPVGKIVMEAAAKHLTPVTLELGGKSPCLIDPTADIEMAARRIVWGKFYNAGQTCVAPDYVLLPKMQKAGFIEACRREIENFFGADPSKSPDYGRIVSQRHHQRLSKMVEGLAPIIGGEKDEASRYFAPTLVDSVGSDHILMKEEIFGPILPILTYEDQEEALRTIEAHPNPLSFYLFSNDSNAQRKIMERVRFGGGCVNNVLVHLANPNLPFGGVRQSGMGNYHGRYSFDTFTHEQGVMESPAGMDIPLKYPPYEGRLSLVKKLLK